MNEQMTPRLASRIRSVLREECGFESDYVDGALERWLISGASGGEYRFQGSLGFGGKLYVEDHGDRWRVSCYREDETSERREAIRKANKRLRELQG
jgi:hypothetical protein